MQDQWPVNFPSEAGKFPNERWLAMEITGWKVTENPEIINIKEFSQLVF